jgi:superfamily II RNA helicase
LDAAFLQKKTVNDEYYTALRMHTKYLQDEQLRKREEAQQKKQADLEEKRLAIAREERELAEIPAFQAEITTCDSVYKYLLQFSNDQNRVAAANAAAAAANATNGANANIRQVDTTANVPTGMMLAKKADKKEEVFFVGGGCKSKKTIKAPKEKATDSSTPTSPTTTIPITTTATLKFPLAIMEQLVSHFTSFLSYLSYVLISHQELN